jgi:UDP-glucose 4-epimerase
MLALVREPKAIGEVFNIGNGAEISIRQLAARVKALTHSDSPIQFVPYAEAFDESFEDMPRRVPDISKIGRIVGYRPTVHLDEIIGHVVDYWTREQSAVAARVEKSATRVPLTAPLGLFQPVAISR